MLYNFSTLSLIFLIGVAIYTWNENRIWRKELNKVDEHSSVEIIQIKLLKLLISISVATFICLTFVLAFLALGLFNGGLFK